MEETITTVGVGGALAVIIIREVFGFIKSGGSKNGDCVSRAEFERHKGTVQYRDMCEQVMKRLDERHGAQQKLFEQIDKNFDEVKQLIKTGRQT